MIVTRASRAIPAQEISGRIAAALAGQYGFGEAHNIFVRLDGDVRTLQVEQDVTGELQVISLSYDARTTRFDVTFDLPSSAELHRQGARYTGTAIETMDAVGVDQPIERGQVLKASDLTILPVSYTHLDVYKRQDVMRSSDTSTLSDVKLRSEVVINRTSRSKMISSIGKRS